jgi:hypothetical protein
MPAIFATKAVTSVITKCTHIMDTNFAKFRLFFHNVSFIFSTLFPTLLERLNVAQCRLWHLTADTYDCVPRHNEIED